jgi:hypothetical protein
MYDASMQDHKRKQFADSEAHPFLPRRQSIYAERPEHARARLATLNGAPLSVGIPTVHHTYSSPVVEQPNPMAWHLFDFSSNDLLQPLEDGYSGSASLPADYAYQWVEAQPDMYPGAPAPLAPLELDPLNELGTLAELNTLAELSTLEQLDPFAQLGAFNHLNVPRQLSTGPPNTLDAFELAPSALTDASADFDSDSDSDADNASDDDSWLPLAERNYACLPRRAQSTPPTSPDTSPHKTHRGLSSPAPSNTSSGDEYAAPRALKRKARDGKGTSQPRARAVKRARSSASASFEDAPFAGPASATPGRPASPTPAGSVPPAAAAFAAAHPDQPPLPVVPNARGRWSCPHVGCAHETGAFGDLLRHLESLTHRPDKRHRCPMCECTFTRVDALKRHQLKRPERCKLIARGIVPRGP